MFQLSGFYCRGRQDHRSEGWALEFMEFLRYRYRCRYYRYGHKSDWDSKVPPSIPPPCRWAVIKPYLVLVLGWVV